MLPERGDQFPFVFCPAGAGENNQTLGSLVFPEAKNRFGKGVGVRQPD